MNEQDKHPDEAGREIEGGGQSSGIPGGAPSGDESWSPTGGPGQSHWREATISEPGLDQRGSVFFAAIEMTRMPMILTDPRLPDNPIVFCNRAFQDLTGYAAAEVVGRNCRFLQGAQTNRDAVQELREAIAEGHAISVEVLNYKRDGTPFWNAVYVAPVHDISGKLIYFFASQLDITRRRTSEQAFRQAQKMESIGQLTAGLAHDFNNLLQVIVGNIENARAVVEEPRVGRMLANAAAAAERGAKLTRQLLAFARKTRLEPKRVDLNALIGEFGEMIENAVGGRIELDVNLRRRLPPILVDPVHLEMALLNILINARDATPEGGRVTVSTTTVQVEPNGLKGGTYVALSVTDTGEGMPPYVVERATEPFFTTKGKAKGTGLGLAMAHGFAQQSQGRLEIESEVGRGTTVRMLFPVASGEAETGVRGRLPMAEPEPRRAEPRGDSETVLVVEDSEDVLMLACDHLEALGYRVIAARSADEALEVLAARKGERIDLLFSDLVMPGSMNGLLLAERVRRERPETAVLLTTGYNEDLVAEGPRPEGLDVIGKPYRRSELADRVRAALGRKGRGVVARETVGPRHEG